MIIADLPADEDLRLQDLEAYEILDTETENEFNELVELAGQICNSPISLISLLDKDRQWFKAKTGLIQDSTSRELAFCAHAILQDDVMQVEDATKDERFHDNPLVTGDPDIRFYAGAPIVSPSGYKLGTLCVIDREPRKLTAAQERALTILSNQVTKLLELRKKNTLLRQYAEKAIAVKNESINRSIQIQEQDKKNIATSLHEDFAQSVASSMMYLKMAQQNYKDQAMYIETAKEQLGDVLNNMRKLSNAIVPTSLAWLPAEELLKEFVNKVAATLPFAVKYKVIGQNTKDTADKALVMIRIVEQWLKVLVDKKEVSKVNITIRTEGRFELSIEDNGPMKNFETGRQEIFDSLVYDRVQSQWGVVDLSVSEKGKNLLRVMLPITAVAV